MSYSFLCMAWYKKCVVVINIISKLLLTTRRVLVVFQICTAAVSAILKLQKRKHKTVEFDPYEHSGCARPTESERLHPGERPDNHWLLYSKRAVPCSEGDWNKFVFIDKTHWGYYSWPRFEINIGLLDTHMYLFYFLALMALIMLMCC